MLRASGLLFRVLGCEGCPFNSKPPQRPVLETSGEGMQVLIILENDTVSILVEAHRVTNTLPLGFGGFSA